MTHTQLEWRNREHALKCEMAAQVLRTFGRLRLEVTGLSMLPVVWPGDLLFIERREMREIVAGEIVLFARGGKLVAHRVVRKTRIDEETHAITRGDGLISADEPVSPAELLGSVRYVTRTGERIALELKLGFWTRVTAEVVRRSEWIARILAFLHRVHGDVWRRETLCRS